MSNHDAEFREALAKDDVCPQCLGELDTGWECNDCGYDAIDHVRPDLRHVPEEER
jgi:hypothetical protein